MTRAQASSVLACIALAALAGCSAIPDKPVRAALYDFGPTVAAAAAPAPGAPLPALVLADIETTSALDGTAILYRLGYSDDHQLRPYAQARWSAPPPQLVRQRLRLRLARERAVLDLGESAALARNNGAAPRVLRIGLEEFSQLFESPASSAGLLRLRVTLLENTPAGEKLLAQRDFSVREAAPSADAAGGARALAAATARAADDITQWLQDVR